MISIIVPLFNCEKFVQRCIDSVLNQTYQNFELLIINDGSTDNSLKLVLDYKDPRIRLFNRNNKGPSSARNVGLDNAKGEYIMFLDADDEYEPFFVEDLYEGIKKYKSDMAVGVCVRKNADWIATPRKHAKEEVRVINKDFFYFNDIPPHVLCIYKATILEKVRYDEKICYSEDWLFTVEAIAKSKTIAYINTVGYLYWDNGIESLAWGNFDYNKHIEKAHSNIYSHIRGYIALSLHKINGTLFIEQAFNICFRYYYYLFKKGVKYLDNDLNNEISFLKTFVKKIPYFKRLKYYFFILFPKWTFYIARILKK